MRVLFTNHIWINQWLLHVCSFHKPHMYPLESLHVCSFHKPHLDPPVFTACVFLSCTTYGSASGHCMCVLFHNHIWIHLCHCMCVLSTNHIWINQWSLHVCSFPLTTYGST